MQITAKTAARARSELAVYGRPVRATVTDFTGATRSTAIVELHKIRGADKWAGVEQGTGATVQVDEVFF